MMIVLYPHGDLVGLLLRAIGGKKLNFQFVVFASAAVVMLL